MATGVPGSGRQGWGERTLKDHAHVGAANDGDPAAPRAEVLQDVEGLLARGDAVVATRVRPERVRRCARGDARCSPETYLFCVPPPPAEHPDLCTP